MQRSIMVSLVAILLGLPACGPGLSDSLPTDPGSTAARPSLAMGENSREPISGIATSICPGREDIEMSGFVHRVISLTFDAQGGSHVNGHIDWTGLKGTGVVSGARYVGFEQDKFTRTAPAGVRSGTEVFHGRLVGLGGTPDAAFRVLWHITVTPAGKVATFFDPFVIECPPA